VRGKSLVLILLVASFFGSFMVIPRVFAACPFSSYDILFVANGTANLTWTEALPHPIVGDTFVVNIYASPSVTDLWTWQAGLTWDKNYLNCTAVAWGEFTTLLPGANQIPGTIRNDLGKLYPAYSESATALTGDLDHGDPVKLLTVTFKTLAFTTVGTIIWFSDTLVLDKDLNAYYPPSYAENDATFKFNPLANQPPVASFSVVESPPYYAPITLTLDASASSDPDGWITSYEWDLDGDLVYDDATGVTTALVCSTPGSYSVGVNVTDNGKLPYYPKLWDTERKTINVYELPSSELDVWTVKWWLGRTTLYREKGHGHDQPGSAFGPGDAVVLEANMTYEKVQMVGVPVGFTVQSPTGSVLVAEARVTNASGIASIVFRVPQSGVVKGDYNVTVTCRVFEEFFEDTLQMYIGDTFTVIIVENAYTCTVTGTPQDTFSKTLGPPLYVKVFVHNYDPYDTYQVLITCTVLDKKSQTIGVVNVDTSIGPGATISPILGPVSSIPMPTNIIPGPATVQAGAYTNWPYLGGIAYCQVFVYPFTITS